MSESINTQSRIVWNEDASATTGDLPRTEPPRHAEQAADRMYARIAMKSGRSKARSRLHWRSVAMGATTMIAGAMVYAFQLDSGLLHLGSAMLAIIGLMFVLRGVLGYGPERL